MNDIITTAAEAFAQGVDAGRKQVYRQMDADAAGQGYLVPDPRNPYADQPTEPARCAPSREEIRAAILGCGFTGDIVTAVQALYASQRTEAEVKAEAWGEAVQATADDIWADGTKPRWGWKPRRNPYRAAQPAPVFEAMDPTPEPEGWIAGEVVWSTPVPDAPGVGLPTPEVPNVGGEQR